MKKLFLSLTIIAMLASCSKNEIINRDQGKIGFSTLNSSVTRGANLSNANYTVYAEYANPIASRWYIGGEELQTTSGGDAIISGTPYLWPVTSALNFYAFAPATPLGTLAVTPTMPTTSALGILNLEYTPPADGTEDFTVATPVIEQYGSEKQTVALQFKHMLCKINISTDLAGIPEGYRLEVDGKASIILKYKKGKVIATETNPELKADVSVVPGNYVHELPITTGQTVSFMIMPQPTEYVKVQITGAKLIKGNLPPVNIDLFYMFSGYDSRLLTFEGGNEYKLFFTLKANKIGFDHTVDRWYKDFEVEVPKLEVLEVQNYIDYARFTDIQGKKGSFTGVFRIPKGQTLQFSTDISSVPWLKKITVLEFPEKAYLEITYAPSNIGTNKQFVFALLPAETVHYLNYDNGYVTPDILDQVIPMGERNGWAPNGFYVAQRGSSGEAPNQIPLAPGQWKVPLGVMDPWKQWKQTVTFTENVEAANNKALLKFGTGSANTEAMIFANGNNNYHPAAAYCRRLGPEWYMPSARELIFIAENPTYFGPSYHLANGDGTRFATSTQMVTSSDDKRHIWSLSFDASQIFNHDLKNKNFQVRCIRDM